jgi:cobalt-zinc-cadmium efflux system protein
MAIALFLIYEAINKFMHPEPVKSIWVIGLGVLSIVLNSASVLLIKDDSHDNMNIKAAYLHLLTDVATSVAVVIGGVLMQYFGIFWIDPLISILIAIYLIYASYGIVKESTAILMQFAPQNIDLQDIKSEVANFNEVKNIHHIHIWQLNDHDIFLEAHLDFKEDIALSKATKVIEQIESKLKEKFHIAHTTLQAEYNRDDNKDLVVENG